METELQFSDVRQQAEARRVSPQVSGIASAREGETQVEPSRHDLEMELIMQEGQRSQSSQERGLHSQPALETYLQRGPFRPSPGY